MSDINVNQSSIVKKKQSKQVNNSRKDKNLPKQSANVVSSRNKVCKEKENKSNDLNHQTTIKPIEGREYLLDGYMTSMSEILIINGKEYMLQRYQNDHQNEYSLIEMKNGVADGVAQLFKNGALSLAWHNEKGNRVGRFTIYKKGKVVDNREWNEIFGEDDIYRVVNSESQIYLEIIDRTTRQVAYRGEFVDDKHTRSGLGYEYDRYSGKMKRFGEWRNNEMWRILQLFDNDGEMMEYLPGSDSNMDVIAQRPVYAGHYAYDETDGRCKRHGEGRELDVKSGMAISFGQWNMGIQQSSGVLRNGWYENNLSEEKTSLQDESLSDVKCISDVLDDEALKYIAQCSDTNLVSDYNMIWSSSCRLLRSEKWQILCASYRSTDGEEVHKIIESGLIHDIFSYIVTKARQLDALVKEMKKWQDEKQKLIDSESMIKTLQKDIRTKYTKEADQANAKHLGMTSQDIERNENTIRLSAFMHSVNCLKNDNMKIEWIEAFNREIDYNTEFSFQLITITYNHWYFSEQPINITINAPTALGSVLKNNKISSLEKCYKSYNEYYIILPLAPFTWNVEVDNRNYSCCSKRLKSPLYDIERTKDEAKTKVNWKNCNATRVMLYYRDLFNFYYDIDPITSVDMCNYYYNPLEVSYYDYYVIMSVVDDGTAEFGYANGKGKGILCKQMNSFTGMTFKERKEILKRQLFTVSNYVCFGNNDMIEVKAMRDDVKKDADCVNEAIRNYVEKSAKYHDENK